jgi:hypothetical protein
VGCLPLAAVHHFHLTKGFPNKLPTTAPSSQSERHLTVFYVDQIVPGFVVYYLNKNNLQYFKNLTKEIGGFRIQDWLLLNQQC